MNVMAEEFGAPYTYAATHSEYTLPLTSRTVLEADLAALPFEIVFIERGVYDMVMRPIHTHFTTDDTRTLTFRHRGDGGDWPQLRAAAL